MQENAKGSTAEIVHPRIKAGGGTIVSTIEGMNLKREASEMYYVVSQW